MRGVGTRNAKGLQGGIMPLDGVWSTHTGVHQYVCSIALLLYFEKKI